MRRQRAEHLVLVKPADRAGGYLLPIDMEAILQGNDSTHFGNLAGAGFFHI